MILRRADCHLLTQSFIVITHAGPWLRTIMLRFAVSTSHHTDTADPHQRVVGAVTLMEYGIGNPRGLIGLDH
jgi:hypothetical protein